MIHSSATHDINQSVDVVYAIIRDYHDGHQRILPKPYFEEMLVEEGGIGEGTVTRIRMNVFGNIYHFHHHVTEPEPGRILKETDMDTGQYSQFTVDSLGDGRCRVTIDIYNPIEPGFTGLMQRLFHSMLTRRILNEELRNLEAVAQERVPAMQA